MLFLTVNTYFQFQYPVIVCFYTMVNVQLLPIFNLKPLSKNNSTQLNINTIEEMKEAPKSLYKSLILKKVNSTLK